MVYLDYAATTPVDPKVVEEMARYLGPEGIFGNPASRSHSFGWEAEEAVEQARRQLASLVNASPDEIVWTSGATESTNLAIKGVASSYSDRGNHIVTSSIEHKAVLDTCEYLQQQGFNVTYIQPDENGLVVPEQVKNALRPDTILVSLMHVNNEIGTITDVRSIGEITREHNVVFHVDAAQSLGRLVLDVQCVKADLVSMSGHKMYGPKGIGALYVRNSPRIPIQAQIHGGGHERGMRSGTLPTHQIVGMGEAARLLRMQREAETSRLALLSQRFMNSLRSIDQVSFNGNRAYCVPGIINACFPNVDGESLILGTPGIAISTGSACTSSSVEASHVLLGIGLDEETAYCSVRFSIGRFTTLGEIEWAAQEVKRVVQELRELSSPTSNVGSVDMDIQVLEGTTIGIQD